MTTVEDVVSESLESIIEYEAVPETICTLEVWEILPTRDSYIK